MRPQNKVAIVTGASKGIGKAIAIAYAREGACVGIASRSLDLLTEIENQINRSGGKALALPVGAFADNAERLNINIIDLLEIGWTSGPLSPVLFSGGEGWGEGACGPAYYAFIK
jgi:NAD(P)-dependent dehydrogenase (short-subunit alcohol dehydrogenase family)